MTFPAESVPDGAIFAPHHLYLGVLIAGFVALLVGNDFVGRDAAFVLAGVSVALFGFALTWPFYPVAGAAFTVVGLTAASFGVATTPLWVDVPFFARAAAAAGLAIAWDDAISHSLGVWTPVDAFWHAFIVPVIA